MRKFQLAGIACGLAMFSISSTPVFAQTTEAPAEFESAARDELRASQPIRNRSRGPAVSGIHVSEEIAPVMTAVIAVDDQHTVEVVQRIPVGEGLFPVMVF